MNGNSVATSAIIGGRARSRRGRRIAPRAPCHRDAGDPQQQAEHAGFAQHFQHPLVRVEGRSIAPGRDLARRGIAGREHVAEIARADAVHRMLADHAQRRAPDARSTGQRDIDAVAVGGQRRGGAFETLRTCGENANNPTANTAPSANTTASLRRPSARQPDKASTSA